MTGRKLLPLTLVVVMIAMSSSHAAEDVTLTEIKETAPDNDDVPPGLQDMKVSPVPPPPAKAINESTKDVYFPYESSISPRLGWGSDSTRMGNHAYYYLYGLQYQFPGERGKHWEASADVLNDGTGGISLGWKTRLNPTEAVRPYYKFSAALHVDPSEQMTTFLRTQNYQFRPACGFEYFLQHPSSVRLEFEGWVSTRHLGAHATLGYSYAW